MAALTIATAAGSRLTDTDDSGGGVDGTPHTNAWLQSLQDKVDALFSYAGEHGFEGSVNAVNSLGIKNSNGSSGAYARFRLATNSDDPAATFQAFGSSYSSSAPNFASGASVTSEGQGGLSIAAGHASGSIRFYSGGSTQRAGFDTSGHFVPGADNTYNLGTAVTGRWKDIFAVTKTSVLDVPWGSGRVLVSVLEGPEYRIFDCGSVTLDGRGRATVALDAKVDAVTNTAIPYQVLSSNAKVRRKTATGFDLEGDPGEACDWFLVAVRAGFENVRWRDPGAETQEPMGLAHPELAITTKHQDNNTAKERPNQRPAAVVVSAPEEARGRV